MVFGENDQIFQATYENGLLPYTHSRQRPLGRHVAKYWIAQTLPGHQQFISFYATHHHA